MAAEHDSEHNEEQFHPRGTAAIMVLFFITIVALWGYVYLTMLNQGATLP